LDNKEILLIHLGGLGDVCLSESLFLSFQKQCGDCLIGLGNRQFLDLFSEYFVRVEGVESRKWLYLFSEKLNGPRWRQIIFIGKDREGILRNRWQAHSEEKIIFIDMYPENAFERVCGSTLSKQRMQCEALSSQGEREGVAPAALLLEGATRAPVIEEYQLAQLTQYGIGPLQKIPLWEKSQRVTLYPEIGFEKEKWHHDNFINLYHSLKEHDVDVVVLESLGLSLNVDKKVFFEDLVEVKRFLSEGGIFVSNDSGMAHLAGASGLFTITIFAGFDPTIWHPRGRNISPVRGRNTPDLSFLEKIITQAMNGSQ
jgi:ADP-heptose:LPS heptosyltransferase